MQLAPYLSFYGRTEEALEFYAAAIGGTFDINRYEGTPASEGVDASWSQKVLHATFNGDGFSFMASDGRPDSKRTPSGETEVSLSLATSDKAEGERVFKALAQGGTIVMPLEKVFWGGLFGMVNDKYGVSWMLTAR